MIRDIVYKPQLGNAANMHRRKKYMGSKDNMRARLKIENGENAFGEALRNVDGALK